VEKSNKFDHEWRKNHLGGIRRNAVGRKGIVLSKVVVTNVSSRFKKSLSLMLLLLLLMLFLTAQREKREKGRVICFFANFPSSNQRERAVNRTNRTLRNTKRGERARSFVRAHKQNTD
jgi:hypothetical protein